MTVEADGLAACPACGFENREGARYCGNCGAALTVRVCDGCGRENPATHSYCDGCGAALAAADQPPAAGQAPSAPAEPPPAAAADPPPTASTLQLPEHLSQKIRESAASLAGERKQVTVLFADVTGSMELAEGTDPERWRAIMDRFFRILADAVHRFEGTVDKFTGDGIMAIFGAPIAHEDHAQRACYAALEMHRGVAEYAAELRRSEGLSLTARVGVNSGEVVVGAIGDDLGLSYTAVGHTVGLAQRMEALAEPGKAYVTEHTAELAAGFLELSDLGEFDVKGSSRPLRVFELVGVGTARGRLDVARGRGLTRFIGRIAEMERLEAALGAAADGDGRVVGIVGEAGVGKSRLSAELLDRARARGLDVYEAHCQAHGRNLPLMPVLEMVRSFFRIDDRDEPRRAREKIAGRMLLLDPGLGDDLPLVFDFLGVPDPERPAPRMDAEARRRRLLATVRSLIQAHGREGPAITLVEDAHWIDPASEEFLAALVEGAARTPTLVVVNFRPEFEATWTKLPWYEEVQLTALGDEEVFELLGELLGEDPSLDGLAEIVRERTGGNPFYIEEMVRELAESGALEGEPGAYRLVRQIHDLAIPSSVQSILAARIDRLGQRPKEVLGASAVVGKDFTRELAVRAANLDPGEVDGALRALVDAEFIAETELYPEPEYAFRHPLTREVALGSQLAERRAAIHRRVAEAIQELDPGRVEENAALVAQHYDEAGEARDAAGWYMRAAAWSRMNDQPATLAHLERACALDRGLSDEAGVDALRAVLRTFLLAIGWRGGMEESRMHELFEEGRVAAERAGDRAALASLHGTLAVALTVRGHTSEGVRHAEEALATAEAEGSTGTLVMARAAHCYPAFLAGALGEALRSADELIELTRDNPMSGGMMAESPYAWGVAFRTLPLGLSGRFEESEQAAVEGAELARRMGLGETLGWAHSFRLGYEHWSGGRDGALALSLGREGVEIAQDIGSSFSLVVALTWLGEAHRIAGEAAEALGPLEQALELIESTGAGLDFEVYARWLHAYALAEAGDPGGGIEEAAMAADLARARGVRVLEPGARIAGAHALLTRGASGDDAAAEKLLDEAVALAEPMGARAYQLHVIQGRARIATLRGDDRALRASLENGLRASREMGAGGWEARFQESLGVARA